MDVMTTLKNVGIIPAIAIDSADQAVPLAHALIEGGIPVAEVTFRTAAGQESIRRMAKEVPEILVGAGTVLTVEQAKAAVEAGAKFIVSPGLFDDVVKYCVENDIPCVPGVNNASDMTKAVNFGLKVVKFFPAEQSGGIAMLKALAPVFNLDFMPTGGVNQKNMMEYLSFNRVHAIGGTWMVKKDMINAGEFGKITALCREAVSAMLGLSVAHVGINCSDADDAAKTAKTICALFGFEYKEGNSSIFAGSAVECMKTPYLGAKGHIAIGTNSVDRAIYHLGLKGVEFDDSTLKTDAKGTKKAIYLKGEFGGFAIHLMQK